MHLVVCTFRLNIICINGFTTGDSVMVYKWFATFSPPNLSPNQSSDKTVFFFTVGECYHPIGFIHVPSPVQALEWSSFPVSLFWFSFPQLYSLSIIFSTGAFADIQCLIKRTLTSLHFSRIHVWLFQLYFFTQSENRLLILCQSGHVVEAHSPNPEVLSPSKTFHLPELPRRSFRFRSIKSRIKVWACSVLCSRCFV